MYGFRFDLGPFTALFIFFIGGWGKCVFFLPEAIYYSFSTLSSCPLLLLACFMMALEKVKQHVDTWYQECHQLHLVCILLRPFLLSAGECSFLKEICIKSKQHFLWHSNCTDVCFSQKVRDVMGLHLEYFTVINRPAQEMEAIKAESSSVFMVQLEEEKMLRLLSTFFRTFWLLYSVFIYCVFIFMT